MCLLTQLCPYWFPWFSFTDYLKLMYFLKMLFLQITIKLHFLPPVPLSDGIMSVTFWLTILQLNAQFLFTVSFYFLVIISSFIYIYIAVCIVYIIYMYFIQSIRHIYRQLAYICTHIYCLYYFLSVCDLHKDMFANLVLQI